MDVSKLDRGTRLTIVQDKIKMLSTILDPATGITLEDITNKMTTSLTDLELQYDLIIDEMGKLN